MKRFFIEKIVEKDGVCVISGNEAKHIARVMRMEIGDQFILMDNHGNRFQVRIESIQCREIRVTLEKKLPKPKSSPLEITLCQAVIKPRPMDYVIQKTSELGVDRIRFFSSKRTVVQWNESHIIKKMTRWNEIAKSATKQSDRIKPAEIKGVFSFPDLIEKLKQEKALKLIMWEDEQSKDIKQVLKNNSQATSIIGIVGPEGGFTKEEVKIAENTGFISISLGYRILRAETAAISMVTIFQYELGDLSVVCR